MFDFATLKLYLQDVLPSHELKLPFKVYEWSIDEGEILTIHYIIDKGGELQEDKCFFIHLDKYYDWEKTRFRELKIEKICSKKEI